MKPTILPTLILTTFLSTVSLTAESIHPNEGESRILRVAVQSESLGKQVDVNIYLPPHFSETKKYPVLYMLHGYSDDQNKWIDALRINDTADDLINASLIEPLMIVMPDIDNSFGLNTDELKNLPANFSRGRYEDFIIRELIPYVDKTYGTIRDGKGRYVGGLSMGGWAALHLAFEYDGLFSKVGAHSPALINDGWLYPDFQARQALDPVFVASEKDLGSLAIYVDCGDTDSFKFYRGCSDLAQALERKGYRYEYHLNAGGHDDAYWLGNVEKYLRFYAGTRK